MPGRFPFVIFALSLLMPLCSEVFAQQIVNNPAPDTTRPSFRVSPAPVASVGGLNDDPNYEITYVPAIGITNAGHLFVASIEQVIRQYDAAGKFVRTIGREGQGPGEFSGISQIVVHPGDSILVRDGSGAKILLFTPDGRYVSTTAGARNATCCLRTKSFVLVPHRQTFPTGSSRKVLPHEIAEYSAGVATPRTIFTALGDDPYIMGERQATLNGRAFSIPTYRNPFGRTSSLAVSRDAIITSDANVFGYNVHSASGALLRTVRAAVTALPVTPRDLAEARENYNGFRENERGFTIPATYPAHGRIIAEPEGRVWVQHYLKEELGSPFWTAFDANGRMEGTIRIPDGRQVRLFAFGRVVLSQYIADDQSTVLHVHRLEAVR